MAIPAFSVLLGMLLLVALAAADTVDITKQFKVASGNSPGSCDSRASVLNHAFQEAIDMATAAGDAVDNVIGKQDTNQNTIKMLFQFFGLNGFIGYIKRGEKLDKETRTNMRSLLNFYDLLQNVATYEDEETGDGLGVLLYCGDSFLVPTTNTYAEVEDGITGVKSWVKTEKPVSEVFPQSTNAFWHIDRHVYVGAKDVSGNGACTGGTKAFTIQSALTICLCPETFEAPILQSLDDARANNQAGAGPSKQLYKGFMSLPGVFLHELAHLVDPAVIDQPMYDEDGAIVAGSLSYGFANCINLGWFGKFAKAFKNG